MRRSLGSWLPRERVGDRSRGNDRFRARVGGRIRRAADGISGGSTDDSSMIFLGGRNILGVSMGALAHRGLYVPSYPASVITCLRRFKAHFLESPSIATDVHLLHADCNNVNSTMGYT